MGQLVEGVWHERAQGDTDGGGFSRPDAAFRNWVTPDGRPGPTGHDGFAAAKGRYHLYVSLACPWAHQTLVMHALKELDDIVSVSVTHWLMNEGGWTFALGEGVVPDNLFNSHFLHEVYTRADGTYTGRATVPILWDQHTQAIVSNESADIARMFNSSFDGVGAKLGDFYPKELRDEIDALNTRIGDSVSDGVYKVGFATTQQAYDDTVTVLFETLDWLEERLSHSRFLCGDRITEADIRLFATLIRFDIAYYGLFKCNLRRIVDYRHLWAYTRDIVQWPNVGQTVDLLHIKRHYYLSHRRINPVGIVPAGPLIEFDAPSERGTDIARLLTF